jgi:hypothetical protein
VRKKSSKRSQLFILENQLEEKPFKKSKRKLSQRYKENEFQLEEMKARVRWRK